MGRWPLLQYLWDKIATGEQKNEIRSKFPPQKYLFFGCTEVNTNIPQKMRLGQNSPPKLPFFLFQRASTILHVRMWKGRNCIGAAPCCCSFAHLDSWNRHVKNSFDENADKIHKWHYNLNTGWKGHCKNNIICKEVDDLWLCKFCIHV